LLLAGTASLLVTLGFSDRIERLKEFRAAGEGDFRPLPGDGSGDALEKLGASLNQTAARLDRTIRTLTEERNLSSAILGSMVEGVAVVSGAERSSSPTRVSLRSWIWTSSAIGQRSC